MAATTAEFVADPIDRVVIGRRHLVFYRSDGIFGHASWGRPDADDVRELLRACEAGLRLPPHRYVVDLRGLEAVEPTTFAPFVEYVRRHSPTLRRTIIKQAQLRPEGLVGAIISGFSAIAILPYPERVFGDIDELLNWAGIERATGLALFAEIDRLRHVVRALHPMTARVRQLLESAGTLPLQDAARRLGVSARSLQRGLAEGGTSYRAELQSFVLERAKALLKDDRKTLTWIAFELGFSSLQHFTTAFRRATGEPPSVWRQRELEASARAITPE